MYVKYKERKTVFLFHCIFKYETLKNQKGKLKKVLVTIEYRV